MSKIRLAYCLTCQREHGFGFNEVGEQVEMLSCREGQKQLPANGGKTAPAPKEATPEGEIVVKGRVAKIVSKWVGGDPPFVISDGLNCAIGNDGDWTDVIVKLREFPSESAARDFAREVSGGV